ncbi:hypothetical protein K488DRAFT_76200 [Vararia minispora EC-137]|uniref:Uncharacterized protein n=1 Tax=Vararia minispora EC-137 TaxID=1314806 RepID=A0ACB8QVX3_9AGAM|nr:hypothetical protein K488DRAFT_76200 [Vararia minispora EC-137]
MANTSAKKIAAQNEAALKNLLYGQVANNIIALIVRLLYRSLGRPNSITAIVFSLITLGLSQFIYTRLTSMGKPRRDASGAVVSPGDDLNQAGVTEWMFDVLYISWAVQVGSAVLGEWVWWIYAVIPAFAAYKLWGLAAPFLGTRSASEEGENVPMEPLSKRQEKLKKRSDRGDPRVKVQTRRA